VTFKGYRITTLEEHLGNLFGSIRIQKHHLIEPKRPRTPPKLPHLGYRTRSFKRVESNSQVLYSNGQKTLAKGRVGVYIALQPFITARPLGQRGRKLKQK